MAKENPLRSSTKHTCSTSDVVQYEFRGYPCTVVHGLTKDPVGEGRGDVNRYAFVTRVPRKHIDILGQHRCCKLGTMRWRCSANIAMGIHRAWDASGVYEKCDGCSTASIEAGVEVGVGKGSGGKLPPLSIYREVTRSGCIMEVMRSSRWLNNKRTQIRPSRGVLVKCLVVARVICSTRTVGRMVGCQLLVVDQSGSASN